MAREILCHASVIKMRVERSIIRDAYHLTLAHKQHTVLDEWEELGELVKHVPISTGTFYPFHLKVKIWWLTSSLKLEVLLEVQANAETCN